MGENPAIFIVEDEAIVAHDIRESLLSLGYSVAGTAKSGEIALEKIRETRPGLVLMDIHLAGTLDGIETAGKIHAACGVPVIFLTAYADKALLERAKLAQPYGYLVKPYDERGLQSAIEIALFKYTMERRLRESEATTKIMVNATRDFLYLLGADGRFLMVNESFAEFAQSTPDDLVGTSAYDLVGKHILSPKMACWQFNPRGERRISFEEELNDHWYDVTLYPVYDPAGVPEKISVSVRNITQKRRAEEQAARNAGFIRAIVEEASEIVIFLNPDGTFSHPSPSFRQALGYRDEKEMRSSFFDHLSISDWQQAKQVFSEVLLHPGMVRPIRLRFETQDRKICSIKGIMSNQSDNAFVGKIVINGWVE